MADCLSENEVIEFVEGRVSVETRARVHAHIDGCANCRALLAEVADGAIEESADPKVGQVALGQTLDDSQHAASAAPDPGPKADSPPESIEEYRLIRPIGRGAMGQVYLGHDALLDRKVAIKFMAHLQADPEARDRFLIEARAVARLTHPNVVAVHRVGQVAGTLYLVSEFVSGQSLASLPKPQPVREVLRIGLGLARGLAAAHRRGVLHRDIKSANAMLADDGEVKLLDFGLAKIITTPGGEPALQLSGGDGPDATVPPPTVAVSTDAVPALSLTASGVLVGTPLYMAPEIWRGQAATAASDVYSLGVVLFELCSGRTPHMASSVKELGELVRQLAAPSLTHVTPGLPPGLCAIVDRCLQTLPVDRFKTAEELCTALEDLTAELGLSRASGPLPATVVAHVSRRRRRGILAVSAAIAATALAAVSLYSARRNSGEKAIKGQGEDRVEMVTLEAGSFQMGSTPDEIDAAFEWCKSVAGDDCIRELFERERPAHRVVLPAFRLDTTEVSNRQFAKWLNQQPQLRVRDARWVEDGKTLLADLFPPFKPWYGILFRSGRFVPIPGGERKPAAQLTWEAARRYCSAQNKRLPTEAEWEYAARGMEQNRFPWGLSEPGCSTSVIARNVGQPCSALGTGAHDVGTTPQDQTPQGVFDLGGNVSEWVEDSFADRYADCGDCRNPRTADLDLPTAPGSKSSPLMRVFRGGNWLFSMPASRSASRSRWAQDEVVRNVGFRCAQSIEREAQN